MVCTIPYYGYTFAFAEGSQKQEDFIAAINAALLYFGGLTKVILGDNLKSFVKKADRYEPEFTELCTQFAMHYGVERHVGIVYNQLFGPLRNETFHSLQQINEAFLMQLDILNNKRLQGKSYSRNRHFVQRR